MSWWMRLRSWSASMARQATAFLLGRESFHPPPGPLAVIPRVAEAVVEPELATLPELDRVGDQPVSTPVRRPGDRTLPEAGGRFRDPLLEFTAIAQYRALRRRPGTDLRLARPGREVGVRLLVVDPANVPAHADLPIED